jgi:hypothetical protein
MEAIQDYQKEQ